MRMSQDQASWRLCSQSGMVTCSNLSGVCGLMRDRRLLPLLLAFSSLAVGAAVSSCGKTSGGSLEGELGGASGSGGGSGFGSQSSGSGGGGSSGSDTFGGGDAANGIPLGDAGCATGSAQAKRQPVYLEFVLDASGSMNQQNKWTAVVPALNSIFTQMQAAADPGVGAGMVVFSDSNDPTMGKGPYPSSSDVPIAFVDAKQQAALSMRISGNPNNSTPTHAALMGGYSVLEGFQPKAPLTSGGKKVLVLITDGVPTDDCSTVLGLASYTNNPCITEAGQELMAAAPKGPIETFVVGVGDFSSSSFGGLLGIDPKFLGNLAQSGGTGKKGCDPNDTSSTTNLCYFEIDPSMSPSASSLQMQFETTLNAIRGQVVSCTFPLQQSDLGTVDPTLVNVEVDGKTVLQDANNGWTYDNPSSPTAIILHGSTCSTVENTITVKVSIILGCMTQIAK
jgi:hypothetical protein